MSSDNGLKVWWKSKLVWQNVFVTGIGIALLVADYWTKTPALTVPGVATLLAGVFGVVVRVWFTDTPINTAKAQAKLDAAALDEMKF